MKTHDKGRRFPGSRALFAILGAAAIIIGITGPAGGAPTPMVGHTGDDSPNLAGVYRSYATADGFRGTFDFPAGYLIVENIYDVRMPGAEATVDSLQGASGLAGGPYPGATAVQGAALGLSLVGPLLPVPLPNVPLPDYPFAAVSNSARPKDSRDTGPCRLATETAGEEQALAQAVCGLAGAESTPGVAHLAAEAKGLVDSSTGTARAEARTVMEGFLFGPVEIGRLQSTASVAQSAAAVVNRATSLSIDGLKIAGTRVGIGPKGLTVADSDAPLPLDGPALATLREQGIELTYLAAKENSSSNRVESAALQITVTRNAPLPNSTGPVIARFELGRSMASASVGGPSMLPGGEDSPADAQTAGSPDTGGGVPAPTEGASPTSGSNPDTATADTYAPPIPSPTLVLSGDDAPMGFARPRLNSVGDTSIPTHEWDRSESQTAASAVGPASDRPEMTRAPALAELAVGPSAAGASSNVGAGSLYLGFVLAGIAIVGGFQGLRLWGLGAR